MSSRKDHGFGTRAIHAGQEPDPVTGAVMTPIYYTSTYAQTAPGEHKGYEYSRTHNRTRYALEANLASLEGGVGGLCFASGLGATTTLLSLFDTGTHAITCVPVSNASRSVAVAARPDAKHRPPTPPSSDARFASSA